MATTLSVFPRVPTTKGVNGRNLVGPSEPCNLRNPTQKAFLCGEATERKPTVEGIHGRNSKNTEPRKKTQMKPNDES